jgi:hypothetical protein
MIQDAFQRRLNTTAPTTGHQGYTPALPFRRTRLGSGRQRFGRRLGRHRRNADGGSDLSEPTHSNYSCQLVPANGPIHPNTGPSTGAAPKESTPDHGADGSPLVQSEQRRPMYRTPKAQSSSTRSPICPNPVRGQQFLRTRGTRMWMWMRARTWPRSARIYCTLYIPSHVHYGEEGTGICGSTPSGGRRVLYTRTPGKHPNATVF